MVGVPGPDDPAQDGARRHQPRGRVLSYRDRWVSCDDDALRIRGYYFPWGGTKRVPYGEIRAVRRVPMGAATGRARIWGTANPRLWAHLDPQRPRRTTGLILDTGRPVKPFITPDDPDAVEAAIRERAGIGPAARGGRGTII